MASSVGEWGTGERLPVLIAREGATIELVARRITTRRATADDVDAMLGHIQAGFDSYTQFAPPGWHPPVAGIDRARTRLYLDDPETWALLALVDGASVGHVAFVPARDRGVPPDPSGNPLSYPLIRGLAHFWQLFVLPEWWGAGIAPLLHDQAIAEMRNRRFAEARLFTPSLHARARRFYERHGWTPGEEHWNDGLELMLREYRLRLDRPAG